MNRKETSPYSGKNLLIIEDEAIIALHLKNLAQQLGLQVVSLCFSSKEAREALRQHTVDIVFLDIYLKDSGTTGIDLAKELNSEYGIDKIIFITANTDTLTREMAEATQHLAYLQKPIELDHIRTALKSIPM